MYDEAGFWLREALGAPVEEWEFESTVRQLARLAIVQNDGEIPREGTPAHGTLRAFLGNDLVALRSVGLGRVGLALSGGGFRAAMFHLGVLAKMAEVDSLRHVEVISCVSGGSIVGAAYCLELKRLLESKADAEITREDYVEVVRGLQHAFVSGVQKNLRTRLLANPWGGSQDDVLPGVHAHRPPGRALRVGILRTRRRLRGRPARHAEGRSRRL